MHGDARRRGLGRGLKPCSAAAAAAPADPATEAGTGRRRTAPICRSTRCSPASTSRAPAWTRRELAELAESIKAQGVIQPIVVREIGAATSYEIIAGERRWRAAQLAGLAEVPVVVRDVDDRAVIAMALIENIQREDLNPLEEAQALQPPDRRIRR